MGGVAIDGAEQKRNVVRIRGIPTEMKENNRHPFTKDADGADELPKLFVRDSKLDELFDVFEEDVLRVKQGEITRRPPREDFPIRAGRPAAPTGGDDDVRIQNRADGGHQPCGAISSTTANNRRNISSRETPVAFMRSASPKPWLTMLRAFSL